MLPEKHGRWASFDGYILVLKSLLRFKITKSVATGFSCRCKQWKKCNTSLIGWATVKMKSTKVLKPLAQVTPRCCSNTTLPLHDTSSAFVYWFSVTCDLLSRSSRLKCVLILSAISLPCAFGSVLACAKSAHVFQKLSYSLCGLCLSLSSLITLPQTASLFYVSLRSQAPQQQYTVFPFVTTHYHYVRVTERYITHYCYVLQRSIQKHFTWRKWLT